MSDVWIPYANCLGVYRLESARDDIFETVEAVIAMVASVLLHSCPVIFREVQLTVELRIEKDLVPPASMVSWTHPFCSWKSDYRERKRRAAVCAPSFHPSRQSPRSSDTFLIPFGFPRKCSSS
jgi:hypothetical protein